MRGQGSVSLSGELRRSLQQAAEKYHSQLGPAVPYLMARGVTQETAATHLLGYVQEPEIGHEQYRGRLAIPYITPSGVIDIRFRALDSDEGAKYLTRPGASSHMYNVPAFQEDVDVIAICEGEFDTMIASQCGVTAVGIAGANNWKDWYHRAFRDYRRVLVLTDGDSAGRELGKRIAQQIDVAVVVPMPDGQDVNEFVQAHGAQALRDRVGL